VPVTRSIRDAALAADITDLLRHDWRTAKLGVTVAVAGGVAHLDGAVPSADVRGVVRSLVSRARVNAVWDFLRVDSAGAVRIVDLGCGGVKQHATAVGVDVEAGGGIDLVADLEASLPFADASLDVVFAIHVLEHIRALLPLMDEIHRVLRPTGVLHVLVPNWRFVNAVADPTHLRFFDAQTFKYFCQGSRVRRRFHPLLVSTTTDTIYADLAPLALGADPSADAVARCFD
jgi:SAM-dependent methyltransferase